MPVWPLDTTSGTRRGHEQQRGGKTHGNSQETSHPEEPSLHGTGGTLSGMHTRPFGRTGWQVSEIGFGAWAIGADWGNVSEQEAMASLHAAVDQGVNFIDTADVYGDGRSEKLVARLLKERSEEIFVATKAGRRLNPHVTEGYNRENLIAFIERSLRFLDVEALDLVQLHCPTTQVYYNPQVFQVLDDLVASGKIKHY